MDIDGRIATSVTAFNNWLANETGGTRLRVDTFQGTIDITFRWLSRTDAAMQSVNQFVRDEIEKELRAVGFTNSRKIYAVYYDGGSNFSCGGGAFPPTLIGHVAAMYLLGTPLASIPCGVNSVGASPTAPGYFEFGMLHEIFYTLGAVPTLCPSQDHGGACLR